MEDFGVTCIASPVAVSFWLVKVNAAATHHTATPRGRRKEEEVALRWTNGRFRGDVYISPVHE